LVAADLLSQAEHGPDSQVILITTSAGLAERVALEVDSQLTALPRFDIARCALQNSHILLVDDVDTAIQISNQYAPEHLILQISNARGNLPKVRNAGSVFLGRWSPESAGDYCTGTNHVLPTYGSARSYSGLGVDQFLRFMSVQELTEEGLRSIAPAIVELARLEGLDAHAAAVNVRLSDTPKVTVQ
jgi:histidinol dehydrogenase